MNPILIMPAVRFRPGQTTVDVPIPHDAGGQTVVYTVADVVNPVAELRENTGLQFRYPDLDAPGCKGLNGFYGVGNTPVYAIATDRGTLDECTSLGVVTGRLGALPRVFYRDPGLFLKADPRTPNVSIEDVDGASVVRITIEETDNAAARPGLWGKFLVTLTATQDPESTTRDFRVYIPMPAGMTSGEEIPFEPTAPPTPESVGLTCIRPFFKELGSANAFQDPGSEKWFKFFWTRPGAEGPCTLIVLDVETGEYTTHDFANRELASTASQVVQVDDGIYFGSYYPPELLHYDLGTGTPSVIGQPWPIDGLAVFALDAGPDGAIVMGAPLGYMALWRPVEGFTSYGPYGGNFAYDVAFDGTLICGVIRGDVWKVVVIPLADPGNAAFCFTSENADGFVNLFWDPNIPEELGRMRFTYEGVTYKVKTNLTSEAVDPYAYDTGPGPSYPTTAFDLRTALDVTPVATLYFHLSGESPDRSTTVPVSNEEVITRHVFPLGSGAGTELVTVSQGYGTIDAFKPSDDTSRRIGLDDQSSCGAVAMIDSTRFAKVSYPGCNEAVVDTARGFTLEADLPGEPGTPHADEDANPRWVSPSEQSNDGGGIFVLADGSAIVATLKQRYESGFELFHYPDITDPNVFTLLEYPADTTHLAMSWGILLADESAVLIATNIKPDTVPPATDYPVPDEARIFRLDPVALTLDWIAPLPGVDNYGPICQVGSTIVGASYDEDNPAAPRTVLFVADVATGALLNYRWFDGTIGPLKPGSETGIPRAGPTFTLGPDGFVWTASSGPGTDKKTVQKIDPVTLEVTPVVQLTGAGHVRIAFHGGFAYLTGFTRLARVSLG